MSKTFYQVLTENIEIPIIYKSFKKHPTIPFIAYFGTGQDVFLADDTFYESRNTFRLEYYFKDKNIELESKLEKVLLDMGYLYSKSTDNLIDKENINVIYYEV